MSSSDPSPQPVTLKTPEFLAQAGVLAIGSVVLALARRYVRNPPDAHRGSDRRVAEGEGFLSLAPGSRLRFSLQKVVEIGRTLTVLLLLFLSLAVGLIGVLLDGKHRSTWSYLVRPEALMVAIWALVLWLFPLWTPELEGNQFHSFSHAFNMSTSIIGKVVMFFIGLAFGMGPLGILLWKKAFGSAGYALAGSFVLLLGLDPWKGFQFSRVYPSSYERYAIKDMPNLLYRNYYQLHNRTLSDGAPLEVVKVVQGPKIQRHVEDDAKIELLSVGNDLRTVAPWAKQMLARCANGEDSFVGLLEAIHDDVVSAGPNQLPGALLNKPGTVVCALTEWAQALGSVLGGEVQLDKLHIETVWLLAVLVSIVEDVGTVWTDELWQFDAAESDEANGGSADVRSLSELSSPSSKNDEIGDASAESGLPELPFFFTAERESSAGMERYVLGKEEPTVNRWGIVPSQLNSAEGNIRLEFINSRSSVIVMSAPCNDELNQVNVLRNAWSSEENRLLDHGHLLSSRAWLMAGISRYGNPFIGRLAELSWQLASRGPSEIPASHDHLQNILSTPSPSNAIKRCMDSAIALSVVVASAGISIGMLSVVVQQIL
eukprot:Plantae.Rhodophyta-Hildenbrandia_rubra.ctg26507.p1 GENE.Plantae.Rhodophyta-Hildenbrandia_rubra.ctg26507~~Plantae.Rhodophyta-Hildenbrandia_rubra.ctg26507.p1  ORF type:complete len:600 (-),score=68.74 Plantae.Rhodophyta-Hildenbrandia_rubra.ctg26507:1047-2846(-)